MSGRSVHLGRAAYAQGSAILTVRKSQGAYVGGRWEARGDHDEKRRLVARKISPSERKLLPEGMRTDDSITVLSNSGMKIEQSQVNGGASPDRVLFDGWWWKVVGEVSWAPLGFYRYVCVRESKGRDK